jgi:3-phenylpropionate/cinnamic acid dioxygenase small subunit
VAARELTPAEASGLLLDLVAQRDIQQTMVRYAESIDYGDHPTWAATFTPDGVFDVRRRGEPLFKHVGTAELLAFVKTHSHAPDTYHKHVLGLPTIDVDGDEATGRAYFSMMHESPTGPMVLVFGRYLDKFVRTDDGGWLFAERIVDMEDIGSR